MLHSVRRQLAPAIVALVLAPSAAAATPTILVKFKQPAVAATRIEALGDDAVGQTANHVSIVRLARGESAAARIAAYAKRADVLYAEPNAQVHALGLTAPDDPSFSSQWAFDATGALAGWGLYPGAYGATGGAPLAVVDTGVSAAHPDLTGRVRTDLGASCLNLTPCVSGPATDDHGHGTHVAGIAGAATNNGVGVAGVAYSSPIIPVKVLDSTGSGYDSDVADGIIWAAQQGARVINLSLGGTYSQTDCNAVSVAESMGGLVVAAAGNSSSSAPTAPAACPGAVGVAATDELDLPASFSNFGSPDVFVSAPGVDIYSTWPGTYAWEDGTSMASPFVAGIAALRFGEHPESTPADVRRVLAASSDKVGGALYGSDPYNTCDGCGWNSSYGYGRVNVATALAIPTPPAPTPPPPSPSPPSSPPPPPPAPLPPPPPVLPVPKTPDTVPPFVRAYPVAGRRGRMVKLTYRVRDNSGETTEQVSVYRGRTLIRKIGRMLRPTEDTVVYWVPWRAPRQRLLGRFCVRSADGSGNASTSCASLRIR
jgi:serine protease